MLTNALLAALAAALLLSGVVVALEGARSVPVDLLAPPRRPSRPLTKEGRRRLAQAALGGVVGIVLAVVTGWMVLVLILPVAFVGVPMLLSSDGAERATARLEALEEWTRSLAGILISGQSLEQGIESTLKSTNPLLRDDVARLVGRLRGRMPTQRALQLFADDLNDVTGDKIAAALIIASERRSGIATLLQELAGSVASDIRARRAIEADRAGPRTSARWMTIVTLIIMCVLFSFRTFMEPYGTPLGQMILLALCALFAAALIWMKRMTATKPVPRFLSTNGDCP